MDFAFSEEQQAIVDLATTIFTDTCTQERLKQVESAPERFDRSLWSELAKADLLGIGLPTSCDGGGYGFLEVCLLLVAQGAAVASVPLLPTVVMGAMPIARFGTDMQRERLLSGVVSGDVVLTAALSEPGSVDPRRVVAEASATADGWSISGVKTMVPMAHVADAVLVPAVIDGSSVGVFVVDPASDGIMSVRQDNFNREPTFEMRFDEVGVDRDALVGGPGADGAEVLSWMVDRTVVGLAALASGVAKAGMDLTASYATERHQFERPIGSFQAVGHRLADCFIDNEAIRLSMLYAASVLADGRCDDRAVAVAKYWASFAGSRIGHAGLHIHGGISIDLDYPIHRYFLWAKQIEHTLGAAGWHQARLGASISSGGSL